jgi:biopolymer transport protein TolQ
MMALQSPQVITPTGGAVPTDYASLIAAASPEVLVVLAVLVLLSILSWTIMILKGREFQKVRRASKAFIHEFERITRLEQAIALAKRTPNSPHTRIFMRALRFVPGLKLASADPLGAALGQDKSGAVRVEGQAPLSESQVEALRYVLDSETMSERDQLGKFIAWLATVGSASPLIGLLGTVLGVINAFLNMDQGGGANIADVAPGVAQALIATAMALATAIPAVFGYNHFANQLNEVESELEGFGSEVIALLVKEGKI